MRNLGSTGLQVSELSFGTAPLGGLFGAVDLASAERVVAHAVELGINLIDTSPYYGDAEEKLGRILPKLTGDHLLSTKAGRNGWAEFDFRPASIRASLERSLRRLGVESVDFFQLHDIDFVQLDAVFEDSMAELLDLKAAGKCRWVGMTCYSLPTTFRAIRELPIDVALNYGHGTLLDNSLTTHLAPTARSMGVGLMNAAAVSLGLLTPRVTQMASHNIASEISLAAAKSMEAEARAAGADIAHLANQYALQCVDADTTVIGTVNLNHLDSAVRAAAEPMDQQLLADVIAHRLPVAEQQWAVGLAENEDWSLLS